MEARTPNTTITSTTSSKVIPCGRLFGILVFMSIIRSIGNAIAYYSVFDALFMSALADFHAKCAIFRAAKAFIGIRS
jgi:hypothetical protein